MQVLESDVESAVVNWANNHGILHTKLNITGRRGWPDRVFWMAPGRPIFIEFKRPGKKPEPLQVHVMNQLKQRGYDVRWTDSKEQAIKWLAFNAGHGIVQSAGGEAKKAPPIPKAGSGVVIRPRRSGTIR